MIIGGVVVETSLDKVVSGVKSQGTVTKKREGVGGGVGSLAIGVEGLAGMGRGWR